MVDADGALRRPRPSRRRSSEAAEEGDRDRPVRELAVEPADGHVRDDAPLEALLGSEPLRRLGALMARRRRGAPARRGHARAGRARPARPLAPPAAGVPDIALDADSART